LTGFGLKAFDGFMLAATAEKSMSNPAHKMAAPLCRV
jgi:hypothetical protein